METMTMKYDALVSWFCFDVGIQFHSLSCDKSHRNPGSTTSLALMSVFVPSSLTSLHPRGIRRPALLIHANNFLAPSFLQEGTSVHFVPLPTD